MILKSIKRNVAFLGTSLPRECGLATFSQDLMNEIERIHDFNSPRMIAVNNNKSYVYGNQVMGQISQHQRADYSKTALDLNRSDIDMLVIQHEFGIYGGESGEYVLDLAEKLKIPFVVIFHTVLSEPSDKQRLIMKRLAELSSRVITMVQNKVQDLQDVYGIENAKITMFHHGVPFVETASRDELKDRYGYANRQILSTFGFLSPGKGIEYAIEAMRGVVAKHPEALYIIWGKTHPVVQQEVGEVYRQKLMDLVSKLGLEAHVTFVDKLLTQEEVVESLVLSDIYMTPYLGKDQAVSGTLAYGIGYGRVIISTPYRYAVEMLADGRGLLGNFHDSASLEQHIVTVLDHPDLKLEMENRTQALGSTMMWSEVAKSYAALFRETIANRIVIKGSAV
ncbi:glycosyltransferase family 4 protein [Paenibacillus sp. HWE-109]|uniref:glycosyltransferase family 4 protein n=1 Tax=Paenibacillus sp. HWE-109 TaxID=1306526 RepID=UPI001EE0C9C6|nr:glycosyltransferase family 4 protein [Paenibacillus sp. HWE-109]UKS24941.1 glycosyltransferase family 4 protein [Paenibacillus sp. HWE-109]